MPKFINEAGGVRYMEGLRSPSSMKEHDTEAKKIAIDLPDVPLLTTEDNPSKWDLVFVCSDGIVFAHRLVISSASKYIMHMFDDQPSWYPTYIHVLDLPRKIVQLLVDLAYTGEMRLTEDIQSDVIDAMHCLGWVHTDCLSADYDVSGESYQGTDIPKSPKKSDKGALATVGVQNAKEGNEKKSPTRQNTEKHSFVDDEDSKMEISQLPDVDISDTEDGKTPSPITISATVPGKRETRRGRPAGKTKSQAQKDENAVPRKQHKETDTSTSSTTTRKSARRSSSVSETNSSVAESVPDEDKSRSGETKQKPPGKAGANSKKTSAKSSAKKVAAPPTPPTEPKTTADILAIDETSQASAVSDTNNLLDSPSKRQRRKPKRFEEYEELDKPKPRASPAKPTASPEPKAPRGKKTVEAASSDANGSNSKDVPHQTKTDESVKKSSHEEVQVVETVITTASKMQGSSGSGSTGTTNRNSKVKPVPKRKNSSETPKHSLITAYFSKKDSKTETDDSSDLSQECAEMNQSTSSLPELEGQNEVDTNDNKLLSDSPTLDDKRKQRRTSSIDSDTDEMPTLTNETQDNKKRSFDEIRSSHNIEAHEPATTIVTELENLENGEKPAMKPARKSSRVSSKAHSTEENEGKNGEDDIAPKRKRSRNEESTEVIAKDSSPLPSRRSSTSKQ